MPVKAAMAAMGLRRGGVPPADGVADGRRRRTRSSRSSRELGLLKAALGVAAEREPARADIEELVAAGASADREQARAVFARLRAALSAGEVRAAEPDASTPDGWRVNTWVKQGILLGFRFGDMVDASMDHGSWPFYDKDTLPLKKPALAAGVRIVPGGSAIRDGAFLGRGVICMPPMYVNIGAYVGERLADRFARARRIVRAGRRARPRQRRRADRRRHRAGRRAARSSSRTMCSSAATPGSTRARSSRRAR